MRVSLLRVQYSDQGSVLTGAGTVRRLIETTSDAAGSRLDLGESWAGLHFMLTGETPTPKEAALHRGISWDSGSLENVLMGGEPAPFQSSFGPARYIEPTEVKRLAAKLAEINEQSFRSRYDPTALMDERIPPEDWDQAIHGGSCDWLTKNFTELSAFYQAASANDDGILIVFI